MLLALNAGADLQVEFAGRKDIIVSIGKEDWSGDLECVTELKFSFLFQCRLPVFP